MVFLVFPDTRPHDLRSGSRDLVIALGSLHPDSLDRVHPRLNLVVFLHKPTTRGVSSSCFPRSVAGNPSAISWPNRVTAG